MKLRYRFFDKEDNVGRNITYDFPQPFHKNMDEDFKMQFGENLTFVKEINHQTKIIRMHTAYDSGKGTLYVPYIPKERKTRRVNLDKRIDRIISEKSSTLLKITDEVTSKEFYLIIGIEYIQIFKDATYDNVTGSVSGYKFTIENRKGSLLKYCKNNKIYPIEYKWIQN